MLQCTTRRDAGARRGLDELADRGGVDGAIGVGRNARLPVDRRDVIDDVDSRDGGVERRRGRAGRRPPARCRPPARSPARSPGRARARARRRLARPARAQVAARESRCAGYEDAHRSATSVTGEPKSLQQAGAIEAALRPVREASRPDGLVQRDWQDELTMDGADAETHSRERGARLPWVNTRYGSVRPPSACESAGRPIGRGDAARRRVVEDDQPVGDAAQLGEQTAPVGARASTRAG